MNMKYRALTIVFVFCFSITEPVWAVHESGHDLTDEEWLTIKGKLELLDNLNYLPTLLPEIMRHRDVLELTDQQIAAFRNWRKHNYGEMVEVMNTIIEKRVEFKKASFKPGISDKELHQMQNDIMVLQKNLLDIKLTCRRLIMDTFTEEQWENFLFAIADNPKLASLLQ